MEQQNTSTSTTITTGTSWYGNCKYRLPCGYCELKKQDCDWQTTISIPFDEQKWKITPTWSPNMNEVTCNVGPSNPIYVTKEDCPRTAHPTIEPGIYCNAELHDYDFALGEYTVIPAERSEE